jgi:hypothetical protein
MWKPLSYIPGSTLSPKLGFTLAVMDVNFKNNFISCVTGQYLDDDLFLPITSSKNESCVMLFTGQKEKERGLQRVDCRFQASLACQVFYYKCNM